MPINPTTLKTQIDTEITNETVDFSITPAEVGGRMKDIIDLVSEQTVSATKTVKVSLSQSQLLNIATVPMLILENTNAAIYRIPISIVITKPSGTLYTGGGGQFIVKSNGTTPVGVGNENVFVTTADVLDEANTAIIGNPTQVWQARRTAPQQYVLSINAAPTGGTGGIDVYITYFDFVL